MGTDPASYFRAKAVQCRHLADIAANRELRERLDDLACEFEEKAVRLASRIDHAANDAKLATAAAQATCVASRAVQYSRRS